MRKVATLVVPDWSERDAGKMFVAREMSAYDFENWMFDAVFAVKGSSGSIPMDVARYGPLGLFAAGVNAVLGADISYAQVKPIMDRLLDCVTAVRDKGRPDVETPFKRDSDLEDWRVIAWLRAEVLSLHVGFSIVESLSTWISMAQAAAQTATTSSTTPTSPDSADK